MRPSFAIVREVTGDQAATVDSLAKEAQQATGFVRSVSRDATASTAAAIDVNELAQRAEAASIAASIQAESLGRRFVAVIRQTEMGDRRRFDRYPVELSVTLPGAMGRTIDLSRGGLLVEAAGFRTVVGSHLSFDIERIGNIGSRVVGISSMGLHCAFEALSSEVENRLTGTLAEIEAEYAPMIVRAQDLARRIAETIEEEILAGRLELDALFDTAYQPISNTNPQQFLNRAVAPLERVLPALLDPQLKADPRMVYCVASDRNAFLPVHNAYVSHPQRADDPVWNDINCRNRRFYDGRTGITASRSTRPFTVQSYRREVGSKFVIVREVDAPIRIRGRHWGACRTGYQF
jgi:methyl-accepting chemotaxis protein